MHTGMSQLMVHTNAGEADLTQRPCGHLQIILKIVHSPLRAMHTPLNLQQEANVF